MINFEFLMMNEMTLESFNKLSIDEASKALEKCCGASHWVVEMIKHVPFDSEDELFKQANEIWFNKCIEKDWLEAFTHHPKIGDLKSLEQKFASTKDWAGAEQGTVKNADSNTIEELAKGNKEYEEKFGFIFIVCATGKSAEEMLELLKDRLPNAYEEELKVAMNEQHKITTLRLQKLLS